MPAEELDGEADVLPYVEPVPVVPDVDEPYVEPVPDEDVELEGEVDDELEGEL